MLRRQSAKQKIIPRQLDSDWSVSQDASPESIQKEEGKKFWATASDLYELLTNAGVVSAWDMNTALGDTIREKYEALYQKLHEITDYLIRQGASGYFWIAAPHAIAELLETASGSHFESPKLIPGPPPFDNQRKLGDNEILDKGTLNQRWRIFECSLFPSNQFLVGVNNEICEPQNYARISIANFII